MESSMDVADDTAPPRADEVEEGTLHFDDDDDDNAHSAWSKYEALKSKATALSAVEMDALAQWKWLNGRLGEAIDSYLELARTHPKYLHVHFKLGYLYLILQNYESAIQHLTLEMDKHAHMPPLTNVRRAKILAQKAYYWCSAAGRMEAHQYLKHFDKKAVDARLVASDGGSSTEGLVAMGCLFRQLGLLQRAEGCFDQASLQKPNDPSYLVEYGKLLLLQRRPGPALGKFSDCRRVAPALSEDLFQAMLGEAVANMRLQKAAMAQSILQKIIDSLSPMVEQGLAPLMMNSEMDRMTIRQILHQAIHCQGCCAILQGDIKSALDVYYTVVAEYADFQLPVMCVTPGARDAKGHLVDTSMFSTHRIVDLLVYLDEIESRYGPDACLYFHRANIYRALGDLKRFIDDLTLVESLNPQFLRHYFDHDSLGDFVDEETMTWIPLNMLESICELTKPVLPASKAPSTPTVLIEAAVHQYFATRLQYNKQDDFYAQVFAIDSLRRLNVQGEVPLALHRLRQGTAISFDDSLCHLNQSEASPTTAKSLIQSMVKSHPRHPTVQFIAALVHMSELRLDSAHHHLTQCLQEINKSMNTMDAAWKVQGQDAANATDAVARWTYLGYIRIKYHALVWRSVVLQLNLRGQEAVGDMRAAMSLLPLEPHAMFQKACMMVHYGYLNNAIAPLRDGLSCLKRDGRAKDTAMCMDYIRLAGINSFSLLPQELKREGPVPTDDDDDEADHLRRKNAIADARGGTVLYANALDKLYEAGVLKLSKGQIGGALRYFESIVSIKDTYVSPAIEAMIDLHKCKDARSIDEKVFLCHQLLSQRAVRFNEVYMLPFEGYKDMSACIAYYPHDMDMYWYRGHLHQRYHNYDAAIDDLTSCILLTLHLGKPKGVHLQRYKKMVLARATLYTHEMQWELALDDLNEVLHYALKDNHVETSFLLHVYDKRCKVLVALKQYDAAIVEMESVLELSKDHVEWNDNSLVNMLLLANLHCHAAIEFQKRHQVGMYTTCLFPTKENPLTVSATQSLRKAEGYYTHVLTQRPLFPLALFLKGRMHALLGESSLALDLWTKCLRQDPKFLVAHFLKGSLRAQQCLPDLALAEFLTVRNQLPAYPHVQMSIGYCYYLQGNVKRAVVELTEALAQHPADTDAWYTRGVCLQELLALPTAILDFGRVVALQPTHWRAWYQRGMCHLLLKDYTSALYDFGKAAPHLRDGHAAVGYIHFCRKMYPDAIDAYSKFLDERSNDAKVLLYRGFSLYMHNERSLAMRDFEKALKVDAACWFGHFIRAFIYQEQGHGDKAMAAIGQCIDQFKHVRPFADTIEPVHSDRANPFFDGRLDVTLDKLKGLILPQPRNNKQYPQSNASPPLIGGTTAAAGDHRRRLRAMFLRAVRRVLFQSRVVFALEKCAFKATSASITLSKQLDKLTEMHPISPPQGTFTPDSVAWAYNLMGVLSASQFKWEEALRNFTMAIRAAPTKPIPHLNRGNVYMQMNAIDKALHEFREALKVDPTHAATMTNTALALRQLGQLEEACRHLYTAATQADDKPSTDQHRQLVYYALANVIRELNRNDEAIEWYTKAAAAMDTSSQDTTQTRMDHVKLAVYHNRGSTMHTQLKFKRALDDYSMALALQPQSFATRMNRAALFISTSKCYQAIQDLRVATSLNRDSATGHRLLRFCERWASALKVACHDFFYAFHAFPCFHDIDIASTTPFLDLHMFRFQQLSHPNHPSLEALEAMLNASESPDFPDMMWDALVHTQRGNFADAQRALLIAKYSTGTSVAEEQACLVWSAQIAHHLGDIPTAIASVEQALQRGRTTSSSSAITAPNHVASDVRGGGIPAEEPRRDTDDDQVQSIQSDLETYLGCLWRLHGHVVDATSAFQRAIAHRPSNFIALFNAASVYLHEGNYSCMLDVLFQIINVTVHALDKLDKPIVPTIPTSTAPFLYMPHDFATTFSRVSVLAGPTVLPICRAIQSVMDEYRGGMTCDVAKHVGRLCVLQGQLATHVEALRDAVQPTASKVTGELPSPRPLARTATRRSLRLRSASRRSFKPEDVKTLNLEDFNAAIAKCTAEMIQRPEAAVDEDAMADYVAQYDRVCAYIDASSASTATASSLTREFSRAMLSRQASFSKGLSRSGSNANSGGGSTAMLAQRTLGPMLSRHGESTSRILVASHNAPSGSSDAVPNDSAASSQSKDLTTSSSLRSRASL